MGLSGVPALHQPSSAQAAATDDEALVSLHVVAVWRYLRVHGASVQEADDLAQEAFLVAFRKGAMRRDAAATGAFLRRTARFLFLRRRRDERAHEPLADAVDVVWERECSDGGDGLVEALRRCLDLLDGRVRRAIELTYGLGASEEASRARVARELGMTENGVKTLLQRARQRLRECVTKRRP